MIRMLWRHRPPHIIEMLIIVILTLAIAVTAALAQFTPDDKTKIEALKLGYILNGNSMVRWGSIDLTTLGVVKTVPITPTPEKKKKDK